MAAEAVSVLAARRHLDKGDADGRQRHGRRNGMNFYLIFDMGGTSVKYACADEEGHMVRTGSFPTPQEGLEVMLSCMRQVYESLKREYRIVGIALSSPGAVNTKTGIVGGISSIPYIHEVPLTDRISRCLDGLLVSIENDANCAALGELWKGAAVGKKDLVSVVCGSGIGGAIIINGEVCRGKTNNCGEFGNFLVNRENGVYRTWSFYTMVKQAGKYEEATGNKTNGKELFKLAEGGDSLAHQLVDEFYEAMAVGFYNIQFALDTELIVLGGGISEAPFVIPEVYERMERMAKEDRFGFLMPKIVPCHFGNQANLYGALFHHITKK